MNWVKRGDEDKAHYVDGQGAGFERTQKASNDWQKKLTLSSWSFPVHGVDW